MKIFYIIAALLLLSGCQSTGSSKTDATQRGLLNDSVLSNFTAEHNQMIANNLVNAMTQLDGLYPIVTTLQIPEARTPFGKALLAAIDDAGYGQQAVDGDLGSNLLSYRAINSESEQGYKTQYRIEVGENYVEREYRVEDAKVIPSSPMRVSGNNDELELEDQVFSGATLQGSNSYVVVKSESVPAIKVFSVNGRAVPQYDLVTVPAASDVIGSFNNIFGSNKSSFEHLLTDYEGVVTEILIFPNDSLRLGNENKNLIKQLASSYDAASEIFSVLGCSQGNTDIDNGNQYLAEGRAERVKEELLLLGVAGSKIFDEGCWGSSHGIKDLPGRGVVLSRKRLKAG